MDFMAQKVNHGKVKKSQEKFNYTGTKTLEVLEGANDYNTWIGESLSQFILPPALEVGAGTGNITKFFLQKKPLYISDVDPKLVKLLRKKFPKLAQKNIVTINIEKKPSHTMLGKFKSIVAVNVLEHIENDTLALKNMYNMLQQGGKVILLVPAKKAAYTKLDKSLGHFRRYEKKELESKIIAAGFVIQKLYYFNFLGLFTWVIRDKVSQTHTHLSPTHVALFDKIVKILKIIEKYIPTPVGISLIVVAKK